jgi:hypothetical protein
VYQCWWKICQEMNVFPSFEYHVFYILNLFTDSPLYKGPLTELHFIWEEAVGGRIYNKCQLWLLVTHSVATNQTLGTKSYTKLISNYGGKVQFRLIKFTCF